MRLTLAVDEPVFDRSAASAPRRRNRLREDKLQRRQIAPHQMRLIKTVAAEQQAGHHAFPELNGGLVGVRLLADHPVYGVRSGHLWHTVLIFVKCDREGGQGFGDEAYASPHRR